MKSTMVSILYLVASTVYGVREGYTLFSKKESYIYWVLILGIIPHYYYLFRKKRESNFLHYYNWLVPISITIILGTFARNVEKLMYVSYISLFGVFYLSSRFKIFEKIGNRGNGYYVFGSFGTICILLFLSFDDFWSRLRGKYYDFSTIISSIEFNVATFVSLIALILLILAFIKRKGVLIDPFSYVFIFFFFTFIIGIYFKISVVLINVYILTIGVMTILKGAKKDHLGVLNFGLMIISALIICRFFDKDMSFIARGIMFLIVGAGFFVINYSMLKRRKENE